MTTALVFPGQGSQRPQMAAPWKGSEGFGLWARADEVLGRDVSRLGTDADADELRRPANCQVALFVHGAVLLAAWRASAAADTVDVACTAGHSLGEYDALLAADVLDFDAALQLVDARARHTEEAADANPGTMVACLGYDVDDVARICGEVDAHVANDNAPGQIVAAGSESALSALADRLAELPGRGKVVSLEVGAAYHSPHMAAAREPLREAVAAAVFADAAVPVVANVDARPHRDRGDWEPLLVEQITTPVRWRDTVGTFTELGVDHVVELCASPVLTGLVKRTDRSLARTAVAAPEDLEALGEPGV